MKRWALCLAVLGCATPRPEPDTAGKVKVMGRIALDARTAPGGASLHCGETASVGFGSRPNSQDHGVVARPGTLFSFWADPRQPLFLNWVQVDVERSEPTQALNPLVRCNAITCIVRKQIPLEPQDRSVYLGTLVCLNDSARGLLFEALDDFASSQEELRQEGGGEPVLRMPAVQ